MISLVFICIGSFRQYLSLSGVTWVSLSKDGVSVTRDDLTGLERVPEVLFNVLLTDVVSDDGLHLLDPLENFLVGETVERSSETTQTGCEGEHGGRESRADQVGGVGRDVTSLVVRVDGEVESHELDKVLVLGESENVGKVERVILVLLDGRDLSVGVEVSVDSTGEVWQFGNQVHRVLKGVLPVLLLVETLGVGLGKGRLRLERGDGEDELSHRVEGVGTSVNQLLDVLGQIRTGGPVGGKTLDLLLGRDLARQQEPEESLRKRLVSTGNLWELGLTLRDGLSSESNTFLGVEDGTFPDHGLEATHTGVGRVDGGLTGLLRAVSGPNLLHILLLLWDDGRKRLLERL